MSLLKWFKYKFQNIYHISGTFHCNVTKNFRNQVGSLLILHGNFNFAVNLFSKFNVAAVFHNFKTFWIINKSSNYLLSAPGYGSKLVLKKFGDKYMHVLATLSCPGRATLCLFPAWRRSRVSTSMGGLTRRRRLRRQRTFSTQYTMSSLLSPWPSFAMCMASTRR